MATELRLRDGTPALTWPLLPTDREALVVGYEQLSERSKFHRFLSGVPHLTDALLEHLVDEVDGVDHIALVIFLFDQPDTAVPAGIARIVRYPDDPEAADVAVTVAEPFRGRGVATALLDALMQERPAGVRRLVTEVAADNPASLRMLQRLGPTKVTPATEGILHVEVELPEVRPVSG